MAKASWTACDSATSRPASESKPAPRWGSMPPVRSPPPCAARPTRRFAEAPTEPVALEQEIEFILQTASLYLEKKPARDDVLSVFAGIRPLVRSGESGNTAALSRDHR